MSETPETDLPNDAADRIEESMHCRRCGYELRGLLRAGVCPECSLPIDQSSADDTLGGAEPAFLTRLALGTRLFIIGASMSIAIFFGSMAVSIVLGIVSSGSMQQGSAVMGAMQITAGLVGCLAALISIVGAWLLTERDPREQDPGGITLRTFARAGLIANLLFSPWGMNMFSSTSSGVFGGMTAYTAVLVGSGAVLTIAAVVGWAAYYRYIAQLSRQIPSPRLAGQAAFLSWAYAISVGLLYVTSLAATVVWLTVKQPVDQAGNINIALAVVGLGTCFAAMVYIAFEVWGMIIHILIGRQFRSLATGRS